MTPIWYNSPRLIAIILYADDILLLAPSVDSLQKLLRIVELELFELDYVCEFTFGTYFQYFP